jgi:putative NADPH-quinone reductase
MRIYGDRSVSGYSSDKDEKKSRVQSLKTGENEHVLLESADALELTGKKAAVLNTVNETDVEVSLSAQAFGDLHTIRQKLANLNGSLLRNPFEALGAQANLTSETVAGLIC